MMSGCSSLASRSTRSASWSPPSAMELSVDQQIRDQLARLRGLSSTMLGQYDVVDIDNAIMNPFVDPMTNQFGCALLAHGKNQSPHCTDDIERVLEELNIVTHTVIGSSRKEFIGGLLRLVSLTIHQQTHTLVLVVYSGGGDYLELHFDDGNLRIEHILDFLHLVPPKAPLVLIFDCVCVMVRDEPAESINVPLSYTLLERNSTGYIFHLATHSELSKPSILDHLSRGLPLGENLGSIITKSCASADPIFISTRFATEINLLSLHSSEPGSPACECGRCTMFSLCNGECTNPSKKRLVRVLPSGTSQSCNAGGHGCRQRHTLQIISAVAALLEKGFCQKLLDGADHDSLIFRARAYYPCFKMSEGSVSSEAAAVVGRLYQYIFADKALWISDKHLERLRKFAQAVNVPEAISVVDKIEDLVMELTSAECVVCSGQMISYDPHFCQYANLEHAVYIIDGAFHLLPISVFHQLYYRVWKNLCKAKGALFCLSFASCSTALHEGLINN